MSTAHTTFEAALSWDDELLACLHEAAPAVRRRVELEQHGEGFGLLEPDAHGWTLCIPDGALVEARVGDAPIDPCALSLDASGERRLRVCAGLTANVRMGEFRFEVRPASA
ncbi:MAG: hypothetical protein M5U28_45690 [Sandaracinaceae bacterium]|nr:hypothetical protein [Sandaracinaceae bacterium]